jgi:sugar-specific transcriptional regulator TrmB
LSLERILDILASLGLTQRDAQVYIYLAKKGPHKSIGIISGLGMHKRQFNNSLSRLKEEGIITVSSEHPIKYSAISIERVLDELVEAKIEQTKTLKVNKKELLSRWRSMIETDSSKS